MTATRCPAGPILAHFVVGRPVAAADATHIAECPRCASVLDLARRVDEMESHDLMNSRIAEVDDLTSELLRMPMSRRAVAASADRYLSPALARRFADLARAEWERDLNVALDHSHIATVVTSRLARRTGGVAEIEFECWKDRSTIHRERGESDAARAALARAATAAERCADREMKRAIVAYADAAICASRDVWQPEQALALLLRCEQVFALRDVARRRDTRTLRGIVYLHAGENDQAFAAFASVARESADRASHADATRNLANALICLGRTDEADELLAIARSIDVELGRDLHVIRADGLAALSAERRGDFESAVVGYAAAQARFAGAGELESSLLMGKSRAICLVALGRVSEACAVLRDLVAVAATASGGDRRRFTAEAFAYLRELAERERITLDIAATVGAYVDRIHVQRVTPFVAPMSTRVM